MSTTTTQTAKATFVRTELARALARIDATVNHRMPREIMRACKVSINGHALISGTDLEICKRESLSTLSKDGDKEALLDCKRLRKAVTASKAKELTIELGENSARVGAAEIPYAGPLEEYPQNAIEASAEKTLPPKHSAEIPAAQFVALFGFCNHVTDPDSSRFALGGVMVEFARENKLRIVGTDGRRLHYATSAEELYNGDGQPPCMIVPSVAIKQALAAAKFCKMVRVELLENGRTCFSFGSDGEFHTVMQSRLVEGRYPNWRQVLLDSKNETAARFKVSQIVNEVKSAAAQIPKRHDTCTKKISLTIGVQPCESGGVAPCLKIVGAEPEYCFSYAPRISSYNTEEILANDAEACLDGHYLSDALTAFERIEDLEIDWKVRPAAETYFGQSPQQFDAQTSYARFTAIIMPMAK